MTQVIKTIDLTPSWQSILPMLLALYADGNDKARNTAWDELRRMAQLADRYVEANEGRDSC